MDYDPIFDGNDTLDELAAEAWADTYAEEPDMDIYAGNYSEE